MNSGRAVSLKRRGRGGVNPRQLAWLSSFLPPVCGLVPLEQVVRSSSPSILSSFSPLLPLVLCSCRLKLLSETSDRRKHQR